MPESISAAVYAQCFKQADSTYMMSIKHDGETRIYASGYESRHSYKRYFTYPINIISDIAAVVDALGSCKQFTKVECMHMVYTGYGGLLGRNGKLYSGYLGGGSSEGKGCACGVTASCNTGANLCNCDSNVAILLKDEGYVTNVTILPITGIRLGDTGSSGEYGYHTVGSLQCYGKTVIYQYLFSKQFFSISHKNRVNLSLNIIVSVYAYAPYCMFWEGIFCLNVVIYSLVVIG